MIPWLRQPDILTPRTVEVVSFTPTNGWFIRFSNKTVQWATEDAIDTKGTLGMHRMGPCFHALVHSVRQQNPQRQEHCIDFLTFGYGTALLVRYENGNFDFFRAEGKAEDCDEEIVRVIEDMKAEQWSLGEKSRLCWWNKGRYILEFVKGEQIRYRFNMGDKETTELVTSIIKREGSDLQAEQWSRIMHWVCDHPDKNETNLLRCVC
ncbi:MAG: hypothetical protein Q9201_006834 [Fulgogasparrea decipioides]